MIGARGGSFRKQTKNAGRDAVPVGASHKDFLRAWCSGASALVAQDNLNLGAAMRELKAVRSFERSA